MPCDEQEEPYTKITNNKTCSPTAKPSCNSGHEQAEKQEADYLHQYLFFRHHKLVSGSTRLVFQCFGKYRFRIHNDNHIHCQFIEDH